MVEGKSIAVVHLVWLPYGIEHFQNFIDSYLLHAAGYPHQLIIAFNGMAAPHEHGPDEYLQYLHQRGLQGFQAFYFESGQDIDVYFAVARQVTTGFVLFLNSYSVFLAGNWLLKYVNVFDDSNVGLAGASGSWQSYYSSVFVQNSWKYEPAKGFAANFRKYKLLIKALCYWRFLFQPFPNPHLRTNGFMLRTAVLLKMKQPNLVSKFKAYLFENGRHSLTQYILNSGLKVRVIDNDGRSFEPADWARSRTFWSHDQENLLIADNQTRIYQAASSDERKALSELAWGKNE